MKKDLIRAKTKSTQSLKTADRKRTKNAETGTTNGITGNGFWRKVAIRYTKMKILISYDH